jgi:hypothetical protein
MSLSVETPNWDFTVVSFIRNLYVKKLPNIMIIVLTISVHI